MDEQRLSEIKARADAATLGPWKLRGRSIQAIDPDDPKWCVTIAEEVFEDDLLMDYTSENGEFIAASRQDVPDLLEYIRKLEMMLDGHVPNWRAALIRLERLKK